MAKETRDHKRWSWLSRAREGETGKAGESEGAPARGKKATKEAQRAQRKQEDRAAEKQRNRNQLLQVCSANSAWHLLYSRTSRPSYPHCALQPVL